jgi:hypothetical protein
MIQNPQTSHTPMFQSYPICFVETAKHFPAKILFRQTKLSNMNKYVKLIHLPTFSRMENENMSFQRHAKLFDFHPNY